MFALFLLLLLLWRVLAYDLVMAAVFLLLGSVSRGKDGHIRLCRPSTRLPPTILHEDRAESSIYHLLHDWAEGKSPRSRSEDTLGLH